MCIASSLLLCSIATLVGFAQAADDGPKTKESGVRDAAYVHDFERVPEAETDPASLPVKDGIVWYGTWEAAMAERERTGRPIMLHMGSPRDRVTRVPGAW